MNRTEVVLGRWPRVAVGLAAGLAAILAASTALAQTSYDQGYYATATRDDPDVGPVSDTQSQRNNFSPNPVTFFTQGGASVTRSDPIPGGGELYFGSAYSSGQALAGDRFVKASTQSVLDFTTGNTNATATAIWSSRAKPGADTMADISVLLDRSLYFGDFLSNAERSAQILDYATANVPDFQQATALSLGASIYLNVQIKELKSGDLWYASLQEDVIRDFVFAKDNDGNPYVFGGLGDRAYRSLTRGSIISGVNSYFNDFVYNPLSFNGNNYPPRYETDFSTMFGIDNVLLHGGQAYDISLSLSCGSGVLALSGLAEASAYSAGCDASNSAYWLGLNHFRNFAGDEIAPVSFVSDAGLDLADASPFAPGGGAAVPEPATWAMMILGFGAAGSALRRRRLTLA